MAERVRALGWQQVEIIIMTWDRARPCRRTAEGFERVLSSVALGEVGVVGSREYHGYRERTRLVSAVGGMQIFGTLIADEHRSTI